MAREYPNTFFARSPSLIIFLGKTRQGFEIWHGAVPKYETKGMLAKVTWETFVQVTKPNRDGANHYRVTLGNCDGKFDVALEEATQGLEKFLADGEPDDA